MNLHCQELRDEMLASLEQMGILKSLVDTLITNDWVPQHISTMTPEQFRQITNEAINVSFGERSFRRHKKYVQPTSSESPPEVPSLRLRRCSFDEELAPR